MGPSLSFTVKDVCNALGGVSRSRVHAWTQLPPFSYMETMERSARHFTIADLLTMTVLQMLEDKFLIKSRLLGQLSAGIHRYLQEPNPVSAEEWVFIRLADGNTSRVEAMLFGESGWVFDMAEERKRINVYLGVAPLQRELVLVADMHTRAR
ncbi:MAG: DNA-binding protein [Rhodocyclales bacterium]|nr:DNA-binding protein [Rhodocyclales bacterium]